MDIRGFLLRIVLPTLLAVALFTSLIFGLLLPDFEKNQMERKRELIRELTRSAWSVLQEVHTEEQAGRYSAEEARQVAALRLRDLRYGPEGKDYFWITDMTPRMIMHPFRPDLEGQDLSDFQDPKGNRVFVEFVQRVREAGSGYVDYVWQWKDDPGRLAPKESFVMGFEPWQWVIGTGIYTEDVKAEIETLTGRLVRISALLVAVVAMILVFVSYQSLRIERRRSEMEQALKSSHDRFQALVESSENGTALVLQGVCVYGNPVLEQMLGLEPGGLVGRPVADLLDPDPESQGRELLHLLELPTGRGIHQEVRLRHASGRGVDAFLRTTPITIEGRAGVILDLREIRRSTGQHPMEGFGLDGHPSLEAVLPFGVFRTKPGRKGLLISANPAARAILGYGPDEDLRDISLMDHCLFAEDRERIARALSSERTVLGMQVSIRSRQGDLRHVQVHALMVHDATTRNPVHVEGILQDVTEAVSRERERSRVLQEVFEDRRLWEGPVGNLASPVPSCPPEEPIWKAATQMERSGQGALLVAGPGGDALGIVTEGDLRRRVLAEGRDPSTPVFQVMTSPIEAIPPEAPVAEAWARMTRRSIRHLVVRGTGRGILGTVSLEDLSGRRTHPGEALIRAIASSRTVEEMAAARRDLFTVVESSLDAGMTPEGTARLITAVTDAVSRRALDLALEEMGPPPVPFSFLVMGSQGRHEQTLVTDQDNAILFQDPPRVRLEGVRDWFLRLGRRVCDDLSRCGYAHCAGGMMASNPEWVQPLSGWKDLATRWIRAGTPQDLLSVNMFFDFRALAGSLELPEALWDHFFREMGLSPSFFLHLAQNALLYKPPRGIFGRILTSPDSGPSANTFNIKEAVLPLVNFARLYALRHGVRETTTLGRLERLLQEGHLSSQTLRDTRATYLLLMDIRLRHQSDCIVRGIPPSNLVDPRELAEVQEGALRRGLGQIATIVKKISFDYLGQA